MSYISDIVAASPVPSQTAKFHLRFSKSAEDIERAQIFRGKIFRNGEIDVDDLDSYATHGILSSQSGEIVCVFRMLIVGGADVDHCYSARFYDLESIKSKDIRSLEIGRFCVHPDHHDPDIFRLAWAEIARFVQQNDIQLLFGCSSFHGADLNKHEDALSLLNERYLGPESLRPKAKAQLTMPFANLFRTCPKDLAKAQQSLPPLLRTYLTLGGWVSDHAVIDKDLNTVHVFTGVEIQKIPQNKRKIFASLLARL